MGECPIVSTAGLIEARGDVGAPVIVSIDFAYRADREPDRSAVAVRHPLLTGEKHAYLQEGPIDLVVRAERFKVTLDAPPGAHAPGLTSLPTQCGQVPCRMLVGLRHDTPFRPGGPTLGLGARFANDSPAGLMARIGYELAAPSWLLFGATIETDFAHRVSLGATAKYAFGDWLHGLVGAGVILDVYPTMNPGARLSGSIGLGFCSLTGTADIFAAKRDVSVRGLLLVEFGL